MATLTIATGVVTGVDPGFVAADAAGDEFSNTGKQILIVRNTGAASRTVTVDDTTSVAPTGAKTFDADIDVAVPAGATRVIGPFTPARFPTTVAVSYDNEADLEVAVVRT